MIKEDWINIEMSDIEKETRLNKCSKRMDTMIMVKFLMLLIPLLGFTSSLYSEPEETVEYAPISEKDGIEIFLAEIVARYGNIEEAMQHVTFQYDEVTGEIYGSCP